MNAADDCAAQIARAWQLAFSRTPTKQESAEALDFLSRKLDLLKAASEKEAGETKTEVKAEKKDEKAKPPAKPRETRARTASPPDLYQTLLSANEFLYLE